MDWEEWTDVVTAINLGWPRQELDPATAHTWFPALKHFKAADLHCAVTRLLMVSAHQPRAPYDLIPLVVDCRTNRHLHERQTSGERAIEAAKPEPMTPERKREIGRLLEQALPGYRSPHLSASATTQNDSGDSHA